MADIYMKLAATALLALLGGCAAAQQLPVCEALQMSAIQTEQGVYFLMTSEQMAALLARMSQLDARTCRLRGEENEA